MARGRRKAGAALAVGAALVALCGPAAPAGAQAPSVTVTPNSRLVDGAQLTVTVDGPGDRVVTCDDQVGAAPDPATIARYCGNPVALPAERPASVAYTLQLPTQTGDGGWLLCGLATDCVIAAVGPTGGAAALSIWPQEVLAAPTDDLADGAVVDVWLRGDPGTTVGVAQCGTNNERPVASRCGTPVDVVIGPDGVGHGQVTVATVLTVGARTTNCSVTSCPLAVLDPAGQPAGRQVRLTYRTDPTLTIAAAPERSLQDGSPVRVAASGDHPVPLNVYQCAGAAPPATAIDGPCVDLGTTLPASAGPFDPVVAEVATSFTGADGRAVTCGAAPEDCSLAVGAPGSELWATTPLSFAAVSLAPATGLVDGQAMTVTAAGLDPGETYRPVYCRSAVPGEFAGCPGPEPSVEATADAAGNLTLTVPARQLVGDFGYITRCRAQCAVGLIPRAGASAVVVVGYAMAEGSLAATPSTGLVDGQEVTLTGTDLMPTYPGAPFWLFPSTGGWGVGQCDRGVVDEPTILGVFTHCAVVPPGAVDVTGSTLTAPVTVRATIERILGGTTDCAATPGACVLVLTRVEWDGTVSVHATDPLTFA